MAKLSYVINEQVQARPRKNRCHGKSLLSILLCFQIVSYGCAYSSSQHRPANLSGLLKRLSSITPLVLQHLHQSADQQTQDALECIASAHIDTVTGYGDFKALLSQVLDEFKTERKGCLKMSGEWHVSVKDYFDKKYFDYSAGSSGIFFYPFLLLDRQISKAYKTYYVRLETGVVLPDEQTVTLYDSGSSKVEGSLAVWEYRESRDEALAQAVSAALLKLAAQYSDVEAKMSLEQCKEE